MTIDGLHIAAEAYPNAETQRFLVQDALVVDTMDRAMKVSASI